MLAKSLVATAAAGCVTGVIWLTLAAVRGNDLGGPTGVLVGMALVLVTGLVLARRGDPLEDLALAPFPIRDGGVRRRPFRCGGR